MKQKKNETHEALFTDRVVRTGVTTRSHEMFFLYYFPHYVTDGTAPFQQEMFQLSERADIRRLFIVAFRGSGKSSIFSLSYPLWAILGVQQKKFVLIVTQTQSQARLIMSNLRAELERDDGLLRGDLGPFKEDSSEWGQQSIVFSNLGARITVASTEQSIRGIRHKQHRPDVVICDDVENTLSAKTAEGRKKTYDWIMSEIFQSGNEKTRIIVIGNLLHEDSLMMHFKHAVADGKISGVYKEYPLVRDGVSLWPKKYPTLEAIAEAERLHGDTITWQREMMLKIIADAGQPIRREWISTYEVLPSHREIVDIFVSIDLAISEKETADYTAIVIGLLYMDGDKKTLYILPEVVNMRADVSAVFEMCTSLFYSLRSQYGVTPTFIIESNGYQAALGQMLRQKIAVEIVDVPAKKDKHTRLSLVAPMVKNASVLFPKDECKDMLIQILNFGNEKHDDMADAFSMLALEVFTKEYAQVRIRTLG